jgi:cellulose synthase/poly-beta-1,6-N-acetylglucosamine synthase-like glycosyltransferase
MRLIHLPAIVPRPVMAPSASVVVCTRNRPELLARCLVSLNQLDHPSYEVIVVDNTQGQPQVEQLARDAGARYLVESRVGLSRARNYGGRAADGEVVAYIDDDATAEPDWLSRHSIALEDPRLTATTGRILPTSLRSSAARAYAAAGGEDLGEVGFSMDRNTRRWFERTNFGGVGIGTNMAFRRGLFDWGWGFRESLGPVVGIPGEEHYAFFTIVRAGHAIAYVPEAIVHHTFPATLAELRRRQTWILRGSVAYLTMLLVEEPEHRRDTVRYLLEAARGTRRSWRPEAENPFAGRLQLLAALATGIPLYAKSRLTERGSFTPPPLPQPTTVSQLPPPSVPS